MHSWWQRGIIYHIYPRSFQDTNGDGIGDLPGIIQRLDYLQWLGVDAVWISPIFPSPMADFGYDVSDYTDIHPLFGTLADMDALIAAAHARQLKVILDYVPNHTSDQHAWFQESRSSRASHKRDWYIWRDPAPDGGPPNNWLSRFSGQPAWAWDAHTEQYYLHMYLPEQPDLNWRNPQVRTAMLDVLRFWFDRGVDGFRVDTAYRPLKDPQLRDNPPDPTWRAGMNPANRFREIYSKNIPEIHSFNRWLRAVANQYDERVLLGEITLPVAQLVKHYGAGDEFHLPLNFDLIFLPWSAEEVRALADAYAAVLPDGAWPNWVLSNHDRARFATRVGATQARVGMLFLFTIRGTPTIYYGEELGMHNVNIPPDRIQDPWGINVPGLGLGRDPVRTPMQWSAHTNAGFCAPAVEPWLPLANDYQSTNVAVQQDQANSMLSFTQALIALRRTSPALYGGSYHALNTPNGLFAYVREADKERYLIVLNFTDEPKDWRIPADINTAECVLSTAMDRFNTTVKDSIRVGTHEGIVLRISTDAQE